MKKKPSLWSISSSPPFCTSFCGRPGISSAFWEENGPPSHRERRGATHRPGAAAGKGRPLGSRRGRGETSPPSGARTSKTPRGATSAGSETDRTPCVRLCLRNGFDAECAHTDSGRVHASRQPSRRAHTIPIGARALSVRAAGGCRKPLAGRRRVFSESA